jgi:hypothetical protein
MQSHLSPKDLALVIGVSESSLKRWVDEGRLLASRTAGGHRRIALHEAIRFIRDTHQTLSRPELLGLSDLTSAPLTAVNAGAGEASLHKALENGQAEVARGLILAQYLSARSFASVCDAGIAHAMHRIGELWRHSENGIMVEHRATEIVIDAVHQVRATLPPVADDAPVAVGGAAPGDPYTVPSLMAATTLLECGFRDVNLGANLPFESLLAAVRQYRPRLVWLSATHVEDRDGFLDGLIRVAQAVHMSGVTLALGGRAMYSMPLPELPGTHLVASMSELAALARSVKLQPAAPPPPPPRVVDAPALAGSNGHAMAGLGKAKPKR